MRSLGPVASSAPLQGICRSAGLGFSWAWLGATVGFRLAVGVRGCVVCCGWRGRRSDKAPRWCCYHAQGIGAGAIVGVLDARTPGLSLWRDRMLRPSSLSLSPNQGFVQHAVSSVLCIPRCVLARRKDRPLASPLLALTI